MNTKDDLEISGVVDRTIKELEAIAQNRDVRLGVIRAAALLEYVLRNTSIDVDPAMTLGQLVQEDVRLNQSDFIRDVNFALGVRNNIAHNVDNPLPSLEEINRAFEYLVSAVGMIHPIRTFSASPLLERHEQEAESSMRATSVSVATPTLILFIKLGLGVGAALLLYVLIYVVFSYFESRPRTGLFLLLIPGFVVAFVISAGIARSGRSAKSSWMTRALFSVTSGGMLLIAFIAYVVTGLASAGSLFALTISLTDNPSRLEWPFYFGAAVFPVWLAFTIYVLRRR